MNEVQELDMLCKWTYFVNKCTNMWTMWINRKKNILDIIKYAKNALERLLLCLSLKKSQLVMSTSWLWKYENYMCKTMWTVWISIY